MSNEKKMTERISLDEFRSTGTLMFANQILHIFGLAIEIDTKTGEIYPVKTLYRGFGEKSQDVNYTKITKHMKDNMDWIDEGIKEIEENPIEVKTIPGQQQDILNIYSGLDKEDIEKLQTFKQETIDGINIKIVENLKDIINNLRG